MANLIYTQAMADNNELPSVGMEFLDSGSNLPNNVRVCIAVDDGNVVYRNGEYDYLSAELAECEPLTPPIELIDGDAYSFDYKGEGVNGIYSKGYVDKYSDIEKGNRTDRFIMIEGNVLSSYCTNTKHLT